MPSRPLRNEDDTDAVVSETPHLSLRYGIGGNDRCPTSDAEIEPEDEHEAILGGKSAKFRTLNDRFRKSLAGGRVMMTAAVSALPAIELTRTFNDFTPDTDPHKELVPARMTDFAALRGKKRIQIKGCFRIVEVRSRRKIIKSNQSDHFPLTCWLTN